jgi:hypothetical protein
MYIRLALEFHPMDIRKVLIYTVVFVIASQIIHMFSAFLTMDYYKDPSYFAVWSKIMMPGEGAPPMEFYIYSVAFSIVTGLIYGLAYVVMQRSLPGKGVSKGLFFGMLLFLINGIQMAGMFMLVNLPPGLLAIWSLIDGLALFMIAGAAAPYFLD